MARVKGAAPPPRRTSNSTHHPSVLNREQNRSRSLAQLRVPAPAVPPRPVVRGYWGTLAHNLSTPLCERYLSAVDTITSLSALSPHEFGGISTKITALIELARKTLLAAGIQLYEFSKCAASHVEYKVAYFRLLRVLKERRRDIDDSLKDRVQRLLLPLTPSFARIGEGTAGSTHCKLLPRGSTKASKPHSPQSHTIAGGPAKPLDSQPSSSLMPPPLVHWRIAKPSATKGPLSPEVFDEAMQPRLKRKRKGGSALPAKRQRSNASAAFDYFDKQSQNRGYRIVQAAPTQQSQAAGGDSDEGHESDASMGDSVTPRIYASLPTSKSRNPAKEDANMGDCFRVGYDPASPTICPGVGGTDTFELPSDRFMHFSDPQECPPTVAPGGREPFKWKATSASSCTPSQQGAGGGRSSSRPREDSPTVEPALGWDPTLPFDSDPASRKLATKPGPTITSISEEEEDSGVSFSPTRGCFGIFGGKPRSRRYTGRPIAATPSR